jgi:hypothetical protein
MIPNYYDRKGFAMFTISPAFGYPAATTVQFGAKSSTQATSSRGVKRTKQPFDRNSLKLNQPILATATLPSQFSTSPETKKVDDRLIAKASFSPPLYFLLPDSKAQALYTKDLHRLPTQQTPEKASDPTVNLSAQRNYNKAIAARYTGKDGNRYHYNRFEHGPDLDRTYLDDMESLLNTPEVTKTQKKQIYAEIVTAKNNAKRQDTRLFHKPSLEELKASIHPAGIAPGHP